MSRKIGKSIEAARKAKGWTRQELADKVGVTRQHVHGVESGHEPSLALVAKFARALGVKFEVGA